MRSVTLSESVLSSLYRPRPSKPISSYLFSLNPSSKKYNFCLSSQNPGSNSFRYTRECCNIFTEEDRLSCIVRTASKISDGNGIKYCSTDGENNTEEEEPIDDLNECSVSHRLPHSSHSANTEWDSAIRSLIFDTSVGSSLKFAALIGLFTLQGSQQAIASTDVATGLQSLPFTGDLGDISTGFASAFLLIFFSELGDKTFFIAALLAARNSAAVVFTGTFGALAAMTIVSVVLGRTFHYVDEIIPFSFGGSDLPVDDIAAVCLLVYFGVSTLLDATSDDAPKAEEEQKEAELAVSKFSGNGAGILAVANTVISTFALVFVAEWGDKSFFSTIALAAASSPLGVIGGALAGHGVATLLAVLGGSLLGTFLSEKAISYIGGVLFLVFAAVTVIEIINK